MLLQKSECHTLFTKPCCRASKCHIMVHLLHRTRWQQLEKNRVGHNLLFNHFYLFDPFPFFLDLLRRKLAIYQKKFGTIRNRSRSIALNFLKLCFLLMPRFSISSCRYLPCLLLWKDFLNAHIMMLHTRVYRSSF